MKRSRLFPGLAGAAILCALAGSASADLVTRVTVSDSYGNVGGEYLAAHVNMPFTPVGLVSSNPFETFCIEYNESLNFGQQYYAAVNTAAVHGGVGGGDPDPLDPKSAYLYSRFITGTLANYVYDLSDGGSQRAHSADDLQNVLWYIEDERGLTWTPGDGSRRDLLYLDAVANAGPTIGNVRVLNLYDDAAGTIAAQDLLVMMPEPASVVLLVLGGCAALRRR